MKKRIISPLTYDFFTQFFMHPSSFRIFVSLAVIGAFSVIFLSGCDDTTVVEEQELRILDEQAAKNDAVVNETGPETKTVIETSDAIEESSVDDTMSGISEVQINDAPLNDTNNSTKDTVVDVPENNTVSPDSVSAVFMSSGNFFFMPTTLTAKKGQKVKITFNNTGTHTFTIDELGVNERLADPNATIEFTPSQIGTFTFYCAIPGHRNQGQEGTLVVTE